MDPDANLAAAAVAAVPRRVARENIKELLAKKRETLLVQVRLGSASCPYSRAVPSNQAP